MQPPSRQLVSEELNACRPRPTEATGPKSWWRWNHYEVWAFDVWGNATDGYDVNDRFCLSRDYRIRVRGTKDHATQGLIWGQPSNRQVCIVLGLRPRAPINVEVDVEGTIYAELASVRCGGYPLGELIFKPEATEKEASTCGNG